MAIYTDRITLVFPIAAKNRVAAASLQTLEITDSGKEFENLVPLDPALVADYASEFNLGALGQVTALEAEKATLTTDLATRTTERDSLQSQVTTLTIEKESLTDQLNLANNTLATVEALVATLQAKVVELEQYRPFNPRIIDASKFYDRLSKDEILTLFSSSDPTTKTIAETILAYKTNDWPVVFESPEFQQMLGYLMQSGTLTEARMAELTRDATRAEAYDAE